VRKLKKYLPFIALWLVNSLLLSLATNFYPANFELGNFWLTKLAATFWAGFWLTTLVWVAKPVSTRFNINLEGKGRIFLFYWGCNSIAIWLIARLAPITGFGISRYYWAIGLGFIMNITQWGTWQFLKVGKLINKK
jgi:uncharacterized membrane protein YvlD (DUF360 family)